jgi:hypothetical protein
MTRGMHNASVEDGEKMEERKRSKTGRGEFVEILGFFRPEFKLSFGQTRKSERKSPPRNHH